MRIAVVAAAFLTIQVSSELLRQFNGWAVQFGTENASTSPANDVLGDSCSSTKDCPTGTSCVAGSAVVAIQSCVQFPVCGGNVPGNCPGFLRSGQLVCAWAPVAGSNCSDGTASCKSFPNVTSTGIYKCMSLDRCDAIPGGASCSLGCKASNGLTCNGRGSCQTLNGTGYGCECNSGWTGVHCETVVNGTCQEGVGSCGAHGKCVAGSCQCDLDYTGVQCEKPATVVPVTAITPTVVPSASATTSPTSSDPNKDGSGSSDKTTEHTTTVVLIVVLVALAAIGGVVYLILAKKKREREAAELAALMQREDDEDRVPTPKSAIQVL
ncbi:unnamed protein product [Aphanomyces euteiches]|uniref:EGF-like domain-containing protein n=1 Tax=Aphanomyces euteiches TaxID=100861 RepID=A0A6G0W6G8_9STRA|nr:hypothetical protein Ae201684_018262 [Aphanomyces euteiches]KAH9068758.1 hypothetical protein Ae201684P_004459 [Aphanomyces euteiches]KAH9143186.1 hypothetical protein AeRB84_012790 [Aphanomyces euteiches]